MPSKNRFRRILRKMSNCAKASSDEPAPTTAPHRSRNLSLKSLFKRKSTAQLKQSPPPSRHVPSITAPIIEKVIQEKPTTTIAEKRRSKTPSLVPRRRRSSSSHYQQPARPQSALSTATATKRASYVPKYAASSHMTTTGQLHPTERSAAGTHAGRLSAALAVVELRQKINSSDDEDDDGDDNATIDTVDTMSASSQPTVATSKLESLSEKVGDNDEEAGPPRQHKMGHRPRDSGVADLELNSKPSSTRGIDDASRSANAGELSEEEEEDEGLTMVTLKKKNPFRDSAISADVEDNANGRLEHGLGAAGVRAGLPHGHLPAAIVVE